MDFKSESQHDKELKITFQTNVRNMRHCQKQRDDIIKELEAKKNNIKSIEEWVRMIWH